MNRFISLILFLLVLFTAACAHNRPTSVPIAPHAGPITDPKEAYAWPAVPPRCNDFCLGMSGAIGFVVLGATAATVTTWAVDFDGHPPGHSGDSLVGIPIGIACGLLGWTVTTLVVSAVMNGK